MRVANQFIACSLLFTAVALSSGCGGGGGGGTKLPILSVSQSTITFNSAFGGIDPSPVSVNVTNRGAGTLTFTAASDSPWLSVTPASGTAPQSLQVAAALGTLTTASYPAHITIAASGAQGSPAAIAVTFVVAGPPASNTPFWGQWGANAQHSGLVNVAGQSVAHQLADIIYDPFVAQEQAESHGDLLAHYQAPLIDGNDVYMLIKMGAYVSCSLAGAWRSGQACGPNAWNSVEWCEARFSWENGQLVQIWSFDSDWKPEPPSPDGSGIGAWEPVFHPLDANNFIYVPGAGGTVWKVNKDTGKSVSHINPFNGMSITATNTFVSGPLTADASGNIYFNVIELTDPSQGNPWETDVLGAWLVKVTSQDQTSFLSYSALTPSAPAGSATTCPGPFSLLYGSDTYPWPPSLNAVAPTVLCGSQRPPVNLAPVIGPDGTIYTVSKAHLAPINVYLISINPDFTLKWSTSLQNVVPDGCGVLVPISGPSNTDTNSCRYGATVGVDPVTNLYSSATIADQASSSPSVLPDGSVLFAASGFDDYGRGHLFKFDSAGNFVAAYDWGWDTTPAVYPHNGTYSIILKDNGYQGGNYCSDPIPFCAPKGPPGPDWITQLNANMQVEWQFQNTTIDPNHPLGYEWCTNMPALDSSGTVYVNSEDGNLYGIPQGGKSATSLFLKQVIGAAYTPLAIGPDGKFYAQNDGHLFAVGN
jgi:hypothetical protein